MSKKKQAEEQTETVTTPEEDVVIGEVEELSVEEQLMQQVAALQDEVKQLKNDYLKEKADVENTKKRLEKERMTERKYAAMDVVKAFIGPLDHFELALKHEVKDEETKNFVQGINMIFTEIKKGLETIGVSEIDALNEDYDPFYHQAVMVEKQDGVEPNKVIEVLQKGYMFKDRVIRPAMVKISE